MKNVILTLLLFCHAGLHAQDNSVVISQSIPVVITWVKNLSGDFSFKNKWDYPEGVYKNKFGQLSCDGLCPPEIDNMKDAGGRIYSDSLAAFYRIVDTTHLYHSISSKAWCFEYAGADYVDLQKSNDTVICFSMRNAGTHSSLYLEIMKDTCIATIELNSIASQVGTGSNSLVYYCKNGNITIDKTLWQKGIMKADFSFDFGYKQNTPPIYWRGKIYKQAPKGRL